MRVVIHKESIELLNDAGLGKYIRSLVESGHDVIEVHSYRDGDPLDDGLLDAFQNRFKPVKPINPLDEVTDEDFGDTFSEFNDIDNPDLIDASLEWQEEEDRY